MPMQACVRAALAAAFLAALAIGQGRSTITLTPATASGVVHSSHTVTATLDEPTVFSSDPSGLLVGVAITFLVTGANAGVFLDEAGQMTASIPE